MTESEINTAVEKARLLHNAGVKGRLGLACTLNFRNKDGEIVQTMDLKGDVPFDKLFSEQTDDSANR